MILSTTKIRNGYPTIIHNCISRRYIAYGYKPRGLMKPIPPKPPLTLIPKRLIPINNLDITIDEDNDTIQLNSPITLKQAWNCYYALGQCHVRPSHCDGDRIRMKWDSMTDLMREDFRLTYEKLLKYGKDVFDKKYVDLRLVLSQNVSVFSGVRFYEREGKIIIEDGINLRHGRIYFNALNNLGNDDKDSWGRLPYEDKVEYLDAYRKLLSSGRDLYQGKIVPVTIPPIENTDAPYRETEPEPEPEPEVEIEIKQSNINKSLFCSFYVSLKRPFFLPFGQPNVDHLGQCEFQTLSTEQLDYYLNIYLDWKAKTKPKPKPKKHIKLEFKLSGDTATVIGEPSYKQVHRYFRFVKSREVHLSNKAKIDAIDKQWMKMSSEERNEYKLQYMELLEDGWTLHRMKLIPIREKIEALERYRIQRMWGAVRWYHFLKLKLKSGSINGSDTSNSVFDKLYTEWKMLTNREKQLIQKELESLVLSETNEFQSPEIARHVFSLRQKGVFQESKS